MDTITMTSEWARRRLKSPASRCLLKRLFTGTGEFPAQMGSNAENVFIWWRHHVVPALIDSTLHRLK